MDTLLVEKQIYPKVGKVLVEEQRLIVPEKGGEETYQEVIALFVVVRHLCHLQT